MFSICKSFSKKIPWNRFFSRMESHAIPDFARINTINSYNSLYISARAFGSRAKDLNTGSSKQSYKIRKSKPLRELDLSKPYERKDFIRRIVCDEEASQEEMLNAFETMKELCYHDVRVSVDDLITLFHNMIQKYEWEHHIYSQMLGILYEYRRCDIAYEIIISMKERNIKINSDDYKDAIRVCSSGKDADKIASSIWGMMIAEGYAPTLVDYELLMNCYVRSNNLNEAEKLFEFIRQKGFKPTVWTYNALLTGYKKNGSWERALQIYQIMKLDEVKPDGISYTIILDLLAKSSKKEYMPIIVKDIQNGTDIVGTISEQINTMFPNHIKGDVNLYNSLSFLQNFDNLFENESLAMLNMQFKQLYLRKASLNALLLWFIQQDDRISILYLYRATRRSKRTNPDDLTYKLLFHYCGIKQDKELFQIIMNDAVAQGFTYTSSLVRSVCMYFLLCEDYQKGMELVNHSIECLLLPSYKTQPFRMLLWKYSEATTFFAFYGFLYDFVKDYGEKKLLNVVFHDVNIMGHSGYDELKGSRNEKIILSMINNLTPKINTTVTEDGRIVLHLHSFMAFVREEGRKYQYYMRRGKPYHLNLNVRKVVQECFSNLDCDNL